MVIHTGIQHPYNPTGLTSEIALVVHAYTRDDGHLNQEVLPMRRQKHEMIFQSYPDITTADPTTLVAHQLTRKDLNRYDFDSGCFRGQRIRFDYYNIAPKVGDFIVRFGENVRFPTAPGIVVLISQLRFYEIIGDKKAHQEFGTKLGDVASCS